MNNVIKKGVVVVVLFIASVSTATAQTYQPGATLDPTCNPVPTCKVSLLNLGQLVGQGTSLTAPAVGSVYFGADGGLGTVTFGEDPDFTWDSTTNTLSIGSISQNSQLNVFGAQLNSLLHSAVSNENIFPGVSTDFTVDVSGGAVTNSTYVANENTLTLTGTQDLSGMATFPVQAALLGTTVNDNTGNSGNIFGGVFGVDNNGGNLSSVTGVVSNTNHYSSSTIGTALGLTGRVSIFGTGNITNVNGITVSFPRFGSGTFTQGSAFDVGSDNPIAQPGLQTTGDVSGYQLSRGTLGSPALRSTGGKVYGFKIDVGGLDSPTPATDEFGVYIGDTEARNYFANNLGINNINPIYKLDVFNAVGGSTLARFADSGAGCTLDSALGLSCSSDQRLKKNIESVSTDDMVAKIKGLEPVTYNWLYQDDGDQKSYGFIAQDVQQIFPEFVKENPDGKLSLSYASFVVPIVASIQDIYSKLDALALQTGVQVEDLGSLVASAIGKLPELFIKRVRTDELCVGQTCLNEQQLQAVMRGLPAQSTTPAPVTTDTVVTNTPDAAVPVVEESIPVDTASTDPILETPIEPVIPVVAEITQ